MYGLIILVIKDFVLKKYSLKDWEIICGQAKVPLDYASNRAYDDKIVLDLVGATCKILNATADEIIETVGYWFVIYLKNSAYGKVFNFMGNNLADILSDVNSLHGQLMKVDHFPEITPPNFRCSRVKDDSLILHYTPGKASRGSIYCPLIVGIIKALADHIGIKDVSITQIKFRSKGDEDDAFRVRWVVHSDNDNDSSESSSSSHQTYGLDGKALLKLFPFHILFSKDMTIRQVGPSLHRISDIEPGEHMQSFFSIKSPEGCSFEDLKSLRKKSLYVMQYAISEGTQITLEGELLWMGKSKLYCFACAPLLDSLDEAQALGLSLKDFALGDKASKLGMLLKNAKQQRVHLEEVEGQEEKKKKEKGTGLLVSIRKKVGPKRTKSEKGVTLESTRSEPVHTNTTTISQTIPVKEEKPQIKNLMTPRQNKESRADVCPFSGANLSELPKINLGPARHSGKWTPPASPHAASSKNKMPTELLLSDSWRGFPLTIALLEAAASREDDTVNAFVVEYHLQCNKIDLLLQSAFSSEITKQLVTGKEDVLFRENSIATRLFSGYIQRIGNGYMNSLVSPLIEQVSKLEDALELDELKRSKNKYPKEFCLSKLFELTDNFLDVICNSTQRCPLGMRKIMWYVRLEVAKKASGMQVSILANLFFLRFLFAGLLTPRFGSVLRDSDRRTLSIISKLMLNLVNGIRFGEKEPAMSPLNGFITTQRRDRLVQFLQQLTDIGQMPEEEQPKQVRGEGWTKEWALKCIQNAMLTHIDFIWDRVSQDKQLSQLFKHFVSTSLLDDSMQ